MPVVAVVFTPRFQCVAQLSQPHGPLAMHSKFQLMERLTQQEALSGIHVEYAHSHNLFERLTVAEPVGERTPHALLVNLADRRPEFIHALINRLKTLLPDSHGSLLLHLATAHHDGPHSVSTGRLQLAPVLLLREILAPRIETLSLQSVAFTHQSDVLILADER